MNRLDKALRSERSVALLAAFLAACAERRNAEGSHARRKNHGGFV